MITNLDVVEISIVDHKVPSPHSRRQTVGTVVDAVDEIVPCRVLVHRPLGRSEVDMPRVL